MSDNEMDQANSANSENENVKIKDFFKIMLDFLNNFFGSFD
jgi:hypothetical protein